MSVVMIYRSYAVIDDSGFVLGIEHLMAVKCESKNILIGLRKFHGKWRRAVAQLGPPFNDESSVNLATRQRLYHRQIDGSTLLTTELNKYEHDEVLADGTRCRSIQYLLRSMETLFLRKQNKANEQALLGGGGEEDSETGWKKSASALKKEKKNKADENKKETKDASATKENEKLKEELEKSAAALERAKGGKKGDGKGKPTAKDLGLCFAFQKDECTRGKECARDEKEGFFR